MNKTEAIEELKLLRESAVPWQVPHLLEAIDVAIEALSEPINCIKCKHYYETKEDGVVGHCRMDTAHQDLVSREEVLMRMSEPLSGECSPWGYWRLEDAIKAIPTARPTGEWVRKDMYASRFCSKCDYAVDADESEEYNFCPNCGAEMGR